MAYHWYVYYLVGYAVALRRIYATTSEVKAEEAPAPGGPGGDAGAGEPARPDPGGAVLYDARSARVVREVSGGG